MALSCNFPLGFRYSCYGQRMRESLQRCQKLAGTKRNALAGEIIEATECLKAWGEPPLGQGRARAGTGRRHPRTGAGWPRARF